MRPDEEQQQGQDEDGDEDGDDVVGEQEDASFSGHWRWHGSVACAPQRIAATTRAKILKKNQDLRIVPPAITEVMVQKREQYASKNLTEFAIQAKVDKLPQKVKLVYRYNKSESFKEVTMLDDGENKDKEAGDGIYTASVPNGSTNQIEYYIIAENKAAINFEPSNYMYQLHKANMAELN